MIMQLFKQQLIQQQHQTISEDMNAAQLLLSLSDRNSLNANLLSSTATLTPSVSPSPNCQQSASTKPLKPHPKFRVKVKINFFN